MSGVTVGSRLQRLIELRDRLNLEIAHERVIAVDLPNGRVAASYRPSPGHQPMPIPPAREIKQWALAQGLICTHHDWSRRMKYTVRPLSDRTWLRPSSAREGSRFDSTWTKTLSLLGREIDLLGGGGVVFEVDVREQDIRVDGMIRANARAEIPAVVVAFESKHGPQMHRCDKFVSKWSNQPDDWQQNVRAIALTLEALRACSRYGSAETGEQYAGFKALPAGRSMPASHMTKDEAGSLLYKVSGLDIYQPPEAAFQRARAVSHPDRNEGDRTTWIQVEQAAKVLGVLS